MVAIFLNRRDKINHGDAVIPSNGYFKGKIGIVTNIKRYFPFPDEYVVTFQIRLTDDVISSNDNFIKRQLEKYIPEHQLVRPLRVGDYIYIADDFMAFHNATSIKFRGKKLCITEIKESPYPPHFQFYYTGTGSRWLDLNLDIPRTNRLLIRERRVKTDAHLPDI